MRSSNPIVVPAVGTVIDRCIAPAAGLWSLNWPVPCMVIVPCSVDMVMSMATRALPACRVWVAAAVSTRSLTGESACGDECVEEAWPQPVTASAASATPAKRIIRILTP